MSKSTSSKTTTTKSFFDHYLRSIEKGNGIGFAVTESVLTDFPLNLNICHFVYKYICIII